MELRDRNISCGECRWDIAKALPKVRSDRGMPVIAFLGLRGYRTTLNDSGMGNAEAVFPSFGGVGRLTLRRDSGAHSSIDRHPGLQ
jgi:hypothetical protein